MSPAWDAPNVPPALKPTSGHMHRKGMGEGEGTVLPQGIQLPVAVLMGDCAGRGLEEA